MKKTIKDRLIESVMSKVIEENNKREEEEKLDEVQLESITTELVELVLEVDRNETRIESAISALENKIIDIFN